MADSSVLSVISVSVMFNLIKKFVFAVKSARLSAVIREPLNERLLI